MRQSLDTDEMFALLRPDVALRYFESRRKTIGSSSSREKTLSTFRAVRIEVLRKSRKPSANNFVAIFRLISDHEILPLVGLANADGHRAQEYHILRRLSRLTRRAPGFNVPRPLFSDPARGFLAIEYLSSPPLTETINAYRGVPRTICDAAVGWILKLQRADLAPAENLAREPAVGSFERNVRVLARRDARSAETLRVSFRAWQRWWETEGSRLAKVPVHGDFHPKNIFVLRKSKPARICVIDFSAFHLGPRLWDFGAFLSQLETHPEISLAQKEVERAQHAMRNAWEQKAGALDARSRGTLAAVKRYFDTISIAHILVWERAHSAKARKLLKRL